MAAAASLPQEKTDDQSAYGARGNTAREIA
jgi:hypothetical protein